MTQSRNEPLFPRQLLANKSLIIGECLIGAEPQKVRGAKYLRSILHGKGLRFDDLKKLGVSNVLIQELYRLTAYSPAPGFKTKPKLIPARRGGNNWNIADDAYSARAAQ